MTDELALPRPNPPRRPYTTRSHMDTGPLVITTSLSLSYSLTHTHRSIGYHKQTQSLSESTVKLMYLRGLYNSTSKWLTASLSELMYRPSMYDTPPSV